MNLMQGDLAHTMKDRQRIGASLADIDPMSVDRSVSLCYTVHTAHVLCTYIDDREGTNFEMYVKDGVL